MREIPPHYVRGMIKKYFNFKKIFTIGYNALMTSFIPDFKTLLQRFCFYFFHGRKTFFFFGNRKKPHGAKSGVPL